MHARPSLKKMILTLSLAAMTLCSAAALAQSEAAAEMHVNVRSMVRDADPVVQAVMAFLLLCSVASWAVLIEKTVTLSRVKSHTRRFTEAFRATGSVLTDKGEWTQIGDGPALRMWAAARQEWKKSLELTRAGLAHDQIGRLLQRLVLVMGSVQEQSLSRLGNWMGVLATIGSTAPFIGLFGTVWGILHSFAQIAATQNTSLTAVAPGIAEALLATAVGLFAAIPATMFYNRFARSIGQVTGMLDNVAAEIVTSASRDVDRQVHP
jgi:biopolymer transport protein ExbB/TolQ